MSALFPSRGGAVRPLGRSEVQEPVPWTEELGVTEEELLREVKKLRGKNTAPGPDGVPGRVLALALGVLGNELRQLFDGCLRSGRFPPVWKEGRVVLLPKEGRPADSPSAYRPVVMLDEAGKLLERVIAARLKAHLSRVGPGLAACQFGFREGRSTVDAILRVRAFSDETAAQGGVALAVSLDIANAFNSLPWAGIREALVFHRVPSYLRALVGDYLRDRWVTYAGRCNTVHRREMKCGVSQRSVLGPLLWNLAFDFVLRGALTPGLEVVSYADDTLVLARGTDGEEATHRARMGVHLVVEKIRALGLTVALHKTEALWLVGPRRRAPPRTHLEIGGARVEVGSTMKYLGLVLDSHWRFLSHFKKLASRASGAVARLGRLMPSLGGPGDRVRRLFTETVNSIVLYGAPVWHDRLAAGRDGIRLLDSVQRGLAVRAIRGYATVSGEAARVVAGQLPWVLAAEERASNYEWRADLRRRGLVPPPSALAARRRQARRLSIEKWGASLDELRDGHRAAGAIRPVLGEWADRRRSGLTFRLVQVLTGHGCFGGYLRRIQREETTRCHHCDSAEDTAQHTLEVCPAWEGQRRVLRGLIGNDLSPKAVAAAMVGGEREWGAMVSFCEDVISQKEAAERERELDPSAPPLRRRREGRRRRAYARNP